MDIKKRIRNSRYCIGLPKTYEKIISGIIIVLNDILQAFTSNENIKMLCCYSYNIVSNIVEPYGAKNKYIILDMHLFDYYMDFIFAYDESDKYCRSFVYKYLSEIYFRKGLILESVCLDKLYCESNQIQKMDDVAKRFEKSTISILFVLIHEILHAKPEIADKKSFNNLFNNEMKHTLSDLNLTVTGKDSKLLEEGYCDVTSFLLLYYTVKKLEIFNISKYELYRTCLLTILSMLFYEVIEDIKISDADMVLKEELRDRLVTINIFACGLGVDEANRIFIEVIEEYTDLLDCASKVYNDLSDAILSIKNRKDIEYHIENKIEKEKNKQKNVWFNIF